LISHFLPWRHIGFIDFTFFPWRCIVFINFTFLPWRHIVFIDFTFPFVTTSRLYWIYIFFRDNILPLPTSNLLRWRHIALTDLTPPFVTTYCPNWICRKGAWKRCLETGWSAYGLSRAHIYHLELNWTELVIGVWYWPSRPCSTERRSFESSGLLDINMVWTIDEGS